MYAEVSGETELFPTERMTVRVVCRPVEGNGLPSGVEAEDPLRVLGVLRSALSSFSQAGPSAVSLKGSTAVLTAVGEAQATDPDHLVEAALTRFSAAKDVITGFKAAAGSVTPGSVKEVMSAREEGSKVEFVLY